MNEPRNAGSLRFRFSYWQPRSPVAWLAAAAIIGASIGTQLLFFRSDSGPDGTRRERSGLLEPDFQLLEVPNPDSARRRTDERVVTASATADSDPSGSSHASTDIADTSADADPDERHRQAIAGNWHDEYHGKRHLTVRADGTGTMIVEPDGIGKKLFAARLTFEIGWSVSDGYVTMKMLGGEPKSKVQLILKVYGREAEYQILELTDDRMLLLDADGKTRYDWRRRESAVE